MHEGTGGPRLEGPQLASLLEAGRGLVAELELEPVLRRLLEAARDLTGARYAALGVLVPGRRTLERFLTAGIDAEARAAIGEPPRGRGLLGELIANPRPLRVDVIAEDPRAHGFPPGHPPMRSFLGVPLMVRGEAYGNLYLADKAGGEPFGDVDQELLEVLAEWAAIAIDHARLYETASNRRAELEHAVRGLEATAALSRELGGETSIDHAAELIVVRARKLVRAGAAMLFTPAAGGLRLAAASGEGLDPPPAVRPHGPLGDILRAGRPQRREARAAGFLRELGLQPADTILCPLVAQREVRGVLILAGRDEGARGFGEDDERVLASFASAAGAALVAVRALQGEQSRSAMAASERERGRWARELHDETLQELGALKMLQETAFLGSDAEAMRRALGRANEQVERIIAGLQSLIMELRPASLDQLGPQAAIEALASRIAAREGLAIDLDLDLAFERGEAPERHPPELEATVYRVVQEALNNVVKHAQANRVRIAVGERSGRISIVVEDDGLGFHPQPGHQGLGMIGMRERVELAGGELQVGSGPRGGTRVTAVLPSGPAA